MTDSLYAAHSTPPPYQEKFFISSYFVKANSLKHMTDFSGDENWIIGIEWGISKRCETCEQRNHVAVEIINSGKDVCMGMNSDIVQEKWRRKVPIPVERARTSHREETSLDHWENLSQNISPLRDTVHLPVRMQILHQVDERTSHD